MSVDVEDNATSVPTTAAPPPGRNEQLARVEVAVLATILGMALLGNGLVAIVLRRLQSRQKLSRMNTMIAHLIVADTAVALFNVLPQVSDTNKFTCDIAYSLPAETHECRSRCHTISTGESFNS
jgi:hypothetical protein